MSVTRLVGIFNSYSMIYTSKNTYVKLLFVLCFWEKYTMRQRRKKFIEEKKLEKNNGNKKKPDEVIITRPLLLLRF
jgi:hypothetical protein